ncbi:type I glyceraldehyde-3-phosphate dehydrogenase [candidate division WWE3 bacterium]|nr:type I glyceraldehyde-3-phosphate dehydrogenase [candidate division WWE3 bacterium]
MSDRKIRIAINGFGRIGRQSFKACFGVSDDSRMHLSSRINPSEIELVAINDLTDPRVLAHLLKYDSVYGRFTKDVLVEVGGEVIDWEGHTAVDDHVGDITGKEAYFVVNGQRVRVLAEKDPTKLPWKELDIDVVLESTGVFETYTKARAHIDAGAKRVLISAPAKGEEGTEGRTLVFGAESTDEHIGEMEVSSNGSCTTNCISPVIQVLHSHFGVEKSLMTTVHAYTATQRLTDSPDPKDLRRGRAAAENIVPSSTGAAVATTLVIPGLANKFDGMAMRVPVSTGSISDITALLSRETTVEEINQLFKDKSEHPMYKDILVASNEPLVSTDIIGNPASAIVDLEFTRVVGGNLVKVIAWYDNEWGYSNRLVEMAVETGRRL